MKQKGLLLLASLIVLSGCAKQTATDTSLPSNQVEIGSGG